MRSSYFNFSVFYLLVTLFALGACQRQYDEPPVADMPNLEANTTIREIIDLANTSPLSLDGKIIKGTVVADDRSGNFYKQIVIQDSTGGIRIDIDAFSLYNEFPIGREVWVKGDGLFALNNNDVVAIGASRNTSTFRIPQSIYRSNVIGGQLNRPLAPTVRTLATLTPADYNTLIQLDNVEFDECFVGGTYAFGTTDPPTTRNVDLLDCATGVPIIVRNSGYADFANDLLPSGNGSIVAIFNSFRGTPQLFIRNPGDVSTMTGTRCTAVGNYPDVSITDLRSQFSGAPVTATGKIRGIVISDATTGQWNDQNMVVQEPNGSGILIRFDDSHSLSLGDYVEVKVGGGLLQQFNGGLLQVDGLPTCRAAVIPNPSNLSITPRSATVADIFANAYPWESTLINVQAASLNGGSTYGDFRVMLNDATGSISMFSGFANFGTTPLPSGTGDVTAVVGNFGGNVQLNIRNLNDVNITGGGGGGGALNQMSIQDVRNLYTGMATNAPTQTKIVGIVISDLVGGATNLRNVVIQETNGAGIVVRFDVTHSFNLGEELEVNISNATLDEFNNVLQLGGSAGLSTTAATVLSSGNSITPRIATVSDIVANVNNWESTLVTVQNASVSGSNYGDFNATITDASGTMDFFHGFANFSGDPLPTGTGSATAIVGDFTNGPQLSIRRPSLDMIGFSGGGGGGTPTMLTIGAVRALYTGASTNVPSNRMLSGIVISDKDAANITARNIVVQQSGGAGIVVRFDNNNTTINLGDSITVDISGATLSEFNGLLQVSGVDNSNATVASTNNSITPRVATVQDILNNQNAWESTLVLINGATITGAATYSGGTTVTDASGSIDMFTRSAATFSGNAVPSGSVNITAIVSEFNAPQINIRNANDVQ